MKTNDMPLLVLSGTPRERGMHHGQQLAQQIAYTLRSWKADLGTYGLEGNGVDDLDNYLAMFFKNTDFVSAIEKWTPDLLEEIQGIADGSNQPFEHILGLQLMDEEWLFGLENRRVRPTSKCTAFGIPGQPTFSGQNMDINPWSEGKQIVLHTRNSGSFPDVLLFSIAGSIGLNGVNRAGLGVTCNTLASLKNGITGLPVLFVLRKLLQQTSIEEAVAFLERVEHASGQAYILSSRSEVRCFECSCAGVVEYSPRLSNGAVFHTNHALANASAAYRGRVSMASAYSSIERLNSISRHLGQNEQGAELTKIKAALSAQDDPKNPVSRTLNKDGDHISFTAGSSIYQMSDPPRLHLAAGPPSETDYVVFDFDDAHQG